MADSEPRLVKIPPTGFLELAEVAKYANRLTEIIKVAESAGPQMHLAPLTKAVSDVLKIPDRNSRLILNGLSTLRGLVEKSGMTADELIEAITTTIETQAPRTWVAEQTDNWKSAKPLIIDAIRNMPGDHPLSLLHKVRELTYAHQNVLINLNLITDLRPVFNSAGDKITTFVLTHVLRVDYDDGSPSPKRIEFALDADDVVKTLKTAERAQLKTKVSRDALKAWRIVVAGSSE